MSEERRTDERATLNIPVRWDGLSGGVGARLEDVSLGGCFVNTRGVVNLGELITLEIKLPSGEWLPARRGHFLPTSNRLWACLFFSYQRRGR